MASKPLTNIDLSLLTGTRAYPLAIVPDGNPATADLVLDGQFQRGGLESSYAYAFTFQEKIDYRFLMATAQTSTGSGAYAVLANVATGQVYWGSEAALVKLGVDPVLSSQPLAFDAPTDLTLLIKSDAASAATVNQAFHLEARADLIATPIPVPEPAPAAKLYTDNPIYRFVNLNNGMYFYTASEAEREVIRTSFPNFRFEGQAFIGDDEARPGYDPVYRFANLSNGSYYYTADVKEKAALELKTGSMRLEGIGFYVPGANADATGAQPVYRLQNQDTGGYLFTVKPAEKLLALLNGGWKDEGVAFQSDISLDATPHAVELLGHIAGVDGLI